MGVQTVKEPAWLSMEKPNLGGKNIWGTKDAWNRGIGMKVLKLLNGLRLFVKNIVCIMCVRKIVANGWRYGLVNPPRFL